MSSSEVFLHRCPVFFTIKQRRYGFFVDLGFFLSSNSNERVRAVLDLRIGRIGGTRSSTRVNFLFVVETVRQLDRATLL